MFKRPARARLIAVENIKILSSDRQLDEKKVVQLTRSIGDLGLLYPIDVFRIDKSTFGLIAGQHRLAAVKKLGWDRIPVMIRPRKKDDALRASENLHRKNLTPLEESISIVAYAEGRTKLPNVAEATPVGGKQPHDRGYSALAAILGMSRKRIAEAHDHAALPPSVLKIVRANKELDKRKTLNLIADQKTEKAKFDFARSLLSPSEAVDSKKGVKRLGREKRPSARYKADKPPCETPLSMPVGILRRMWRDSEMKKIYDNSSKGVRAQFVTICLR